MRVLAGLSLLFLLLGGAMLAVGFGGFADEWLTDNVSCGAEYDLHPCEPGEAQAVLKIVGGIFVGIALIELAAALIWSRVARVARHAGASLMSAQAASGIQGGWLPTTPAPQPAEPVAPAGDALVDRLAKLADLRDRGILTEAEFLAQKAKLLA